MDGHGAEVDLGHGQRDHHDDGQQGVEVVGNGGDEQGQTVGVAVLRKAADGGGPGADGSDDAHRRGGGVDQVGQLGTGDVVLVGDRTHDAAHGQAVEVVVDEDQDAQADGGQLRADAGLDVGGGPLTEGGGTTSCVHQGDHNAQDDQENQDAYIPAV